jgi:hypothetical protein
VRRSGGRILLGDNTGCLAAADHQVTLFWDLDFCWNPFYLGIRGDSKVSIDREVIEKSPYMGKMVCIYKTSSVCTPGQDNDLFSVFFKQRHIWKEKYI